MAEPNALEAGLVIERSSGVTTLCYDGKPNVTITVPDEIWGKWNNAAGIPRYILQHLRSKRTGSELHVRVDDLGIRGESFIIESIELDKGLYFLVTAFGQSDVAVSVQGWDAFGFPGQYMLAGKCKHHSQYVKDIRSQMMRDWVYDKTIPKSAMTFGDIVRYEGTRKDPLFLSSLVLHETLPSSFFESLTLVVAGS